MKIAIVIPSMEAPSKQISCVICGSDSGKIILRPEELSVRRRLWIRWHVVRCCGCGFVYVNPRLPEDKTEGIYRSEDYNFVRQESPFSSIGDTPHHYRVLKEICQFVSSGKLLDIGSSSGDFLVAAKTAGWRAQGVELSVTAAKVAEKRGCKVFRNPLRDISFPSASFDVVTMWDVIEHLPDLQMELREVYRLLRKGGIFAFETPNWNSIYRHLLGKRWAAMMPRLHLYYFDAKTASRLLETLGFEVILIKTEIVDFFSPEGWRRGLNFGWPKLILRECCSKLILRLPKSWIKTLNAVQHPVQRRDCVTANNSIPLRSTTFIRAVRALNYPVNAFFLYLGMGEQLRVYARKR